MKRNSVRMAALGVVAALLVGGMSVSPAWAYFTDSHTAEGGIRIAVKPETDIEESFDNLGKHVFIRNKSANVPVFVRAKVYVSHEQYASISGTNWSDPDGEGWRYWANPLEPGKVTDELNVKMAWKSKDTVTVTYPDGTTQTFNNVDTTGENFNVIVVYEAVPAPYGATDPKAADWSMASNE